MPAKGVLHWNSFFDQIVGTAVLMIFIMALINVRYIIFIFI
jgi:glycerol uptake facilitator-like aquaporin